MIVGLTGGIGSGKSTVAHYFRGLGVDVVSCDQIVHELLAPNTPSAKHVIEHFGPSFVTNDVLDRKALREHVFKNPKERIWLENYLHPLVREKLEERPLGEPYTLVEIPLLFEAGFTQDVDRILTIDCPTALQIERVVNRDKSAPEWVQAIIDTQTPRESRVAHSHDVLENSGDLNLLQVKVTALHQQYIKLSKS